MSIRSALSVALAVAVVGLRAQSPPDLVLVNGKVFTADAAAPIVEAVAIRGSIVVGRGSTAQMRGLAGPATRIIDAGGRVVVPGFNDAHFHVGARPPGAVLQLKSDDPTLDEVVAAIRETAATAKDGWIFGTVAERALTDPRATRATLDAAAPGRLVKLAAWTGHGNVLSSAALRALGIEDRAPDPPFGRYGRTPDGTVNGVLEEYADTRANREMTRLAGRPAIVESLRRVADEAIGYGVTSIQAMANAVPAAELVSMMDEAATPIRWRVIRFPVSLVEAEDPGSLGPIAHPKSGLVTVSGTKWILDGTPVERLSALNADYADRAGWSGRLNFSAAQLDAALRRSIETHDQILLHATGDRTIAAVLEAMARVAPVAEWRATRPRFEHGDMITAAQFPTLRGFDMLLVQNPAHFTLTPTLAERLGPERAARAQPLKSVLAAGVHVALGSDGPLNPFLNMMFAITHPDNPREALTREQVVTAYTLGSAYAEAQESRKGSLVAGKAADLAVLSQDIFSVAPDALPATRALMTIVDGRVVRDALATPASLAPRPAPRPPAPPPGPPRPEDGSAAPDGYAPPPAWPGQTKAPPPKASATFAVQTFAEGLNGAFAVDLLPDGRLIVGERAGRIRLVGTDGHVSEPIENMPADLWAHGQGLTDVRPDRAFATNRTLYLAYAVLPHGSRMDALPRTPGVLVVARATLSRDDRRLENLNVLLDAEGAGGRVIQAGDGTLLVTSTIPSGIGVKSVDWPQPQQPASLMGKILRINADGSIPKDNPFTGRAGARPEIYALGFRDIQGVAIHPTTGKLWTSEHGPRGGDEINAVAKGRNYGFPAISYGREYTGEPINGDRTAQPGMEQPVYFWTPDIAPAGIAFYTGRLFPEWSGNLFVAALADRSLHRLVLNGERVVAEERLLGELNARIRGVVSAPDGALYVMTDGPAGKILRLAAK